MDSFTQALLGASVAESLVGKQAGRKASAWGAFLGIVPDLDFLVRYSNPVDSFTYHRSFSHSLLVFILLTPVLVWVIVKLHPSFAAHRWRWMWVVALCLVTHVALDALTIYGTQLLWPLSEHPFGMGSIFIIDPLYSLPLLAGCIAVLITRNRRGRRWLNAGLVISSAYLAWGLVAQQIMTGRIVDHLAAQDIRPQQMSVTPAPFNSILWRFVARVEGGYYDGFMSFLDPPGVPAMQFHASRDELIESLQAFPSARRLMWFSKGQFGVGQRGEDIVISDLRMGVAPEYVFSYKVAQISAQGLAEVMPEHINERNVTRDKLAWIFYRISDPTLPLPVGNFGP
jgi:inner membrane protein